VLNVALKQDNQRDLTEYHIADYRHGGRGWKKFMWSERK